MQKLIEKEVPDQLTLNTLASAVLGTAAGDSAGGRLVNSSAKLLTSSSPLM